MTTPPTKEQIKAMADRAEARSRGDDAAKEFVAVALTEGEIDDEIRKLATLPEGVYESSRKAALARLGEGWRAETLDRLVNAERKKRTAKKTAPEFDPAELQRSAERIIKHQDILDLFAKELSNVIAGESVNGKLLYLVGTSRLFDKPMSAAVKGTSAAGKSEIRKRVLGFFPPEDVISFTSLSEKALLFFDDDFRHKILSMGEAAATEEQSFQDYLLRELISEGRLVHPMAQKVGNEIRTVTIVKEGPVAFMVTTTKDKLYHENETRLLSLEVDDSEDQTKIVLDKVAHLAGLRATTSVDHKPWQDFQRWLAAGERRVVVPFAVALARLIPPVAVRLRRDFSQVIYAIQAHALLHREHRGRDDAGRIIANIEHDYAATRKLLNPTISEGSGVAVSKAMAETIEAVTKTTIGMLEAEGASPLDVARYLKLDKS